MKKKRERGNKLPFRELASKKPFITTQPGKPIVCSGVNLWLHRWPKGSTSSRGVDPFLDFIECLMPMEGGGDEEEELFSLI
ncbi:hypothetical protein NPIL_107051 [Nephila pilipes]|uniref:Uncharacterized protein n=1 Tax=Nephila pilipes TaxID=299642 RepID=A0A8X6T8H3_NEPPI|nr:hypothetical protein NPIL_107051 [Nephila pilipes]